MAKDPQETQATSAPTTQPTVPGAEPSVVGKVYSGFNGILAKGTELAESIPGGVGDWFKKNPDVTKYGGISLVGGALVAIGGLLKKTMPFGGGLVGGLMSIVGGVIAIWGMLNGVLRTFFGFGEKGDGKGVDDPLEALKAPDIAVKAKMNVPEISAQSQTAYKHLGEALAKADEMQKRATELEKTDKTAAQKLRDEAAAITKTATEMRQKMEPAIRDLNAGKLSPEATSQLAIVSLKINYEYGADKTTGVIKAIEDMKTNGISSSATRYQLQEFMNKHPEVINSAAVGGTISKEGVDALIKTMNDNRVLQASGTDPLGMGIKINTEASLRESVIGTLRGKIQNNNMGITVEPEKVSGTVPTIIYTPGVAVPVPAVEPKPTVEPKKDAAPATPVPEKSVVPEEKKEKVDARLDKLPAQITAALEREVRDPLLVINTGLDKISPELQKVHGWINGGKIDAKTLEQAQSQVYSADSKGTIVAISNEVGEGFYAVRIKKTVTGDFSVYAEKTGGILTSAVNFDSKGVIERQVFLSGFDSGKSRDTEITYGKDGNIATVQVAHKIYADAVGGTVDDASVNRVSDTVFAVKADGGFDMEKKTKEGEVVYAASYDSRKNKLTPTVDNRATMAAAEVAETLAAVGGSSSFGVDGSGRNRGDGQGSPKADKSQTRT